jgi:hypothetical protein
MPDADGSARPARGEWSGADTERVLSSPGAAAGEPTDEEAAFLRATAHWPSLSEDDLAALPAYGGLASVAAAEIRRLRAALRSASPIAAPGAGEAPKRDDPYAEPALAWPCPNCGADSGDRCRTPGDRMTAIHKERKQAGGLQGGAGA